MSAIVIGTFVLASILFSFQNCSNGFYAASRSDGGSNNPSATLSDYRKISYKGVYTVALPGNVVSSGPSATSLSPCGNHLITAAPSGIKVLDSETLAVLGVASAVSASTAVQTYKISNTECIVQIGADPYNLNMTNPSQPKLVARDKNEIDQLYSAYMKDFEGTALYFENILEDGTVRIAKPSNLPPGYVLLSTLTRPGYKAANTIRTHDKKLIVIWRLATLDEMNPTPEDQVAVIYNMANPQEPQELGHLLVPAQYRTFVLSMSTVFAFSETHVLAVGFKDLAAPVVLGTVPVLMPSGSLSFYSDELGMLPQDGPIVFMDEGKAYVFKIENY